MKLDVRILRLNKWYVPKSVDLYEEDIKVVLGYFDDFDVQKVDDTIDLDTIHPFTAGYEKLAQQKLSQKKELVDYSSQDQMLFLNISEDGDHDGTAFTQEYVDKFWENINSESECPCIYLSMIQISHSNCSKLKETLQKIKSVFEKDYLSYISFDYCDIVLFAQNMQIREYLNKMRELFVADAVSGNPIFDTFSMVSFRSKDSRGKEKGMLVMSAPETKDNFYATINLSIRDHSKFRQWFQQIIQNQKLDIKFYNLYGRNDISITNENADMRWLLGMMDSLHKKENQKMCWTFETFIKIAFDDKKDPMEMTTNLSADLAKDEKNYEEISKFLQSKTTEFEETVNQTRFSNKEKYILPVYEVRDCICSIVKNNFAEEFICCIYESFLHFVTYMKGVFKRAAESSEENVDWESDIAESYDKYFVALNTLVNSTMHNDRQFVTATAFNAIFYSVPPKIIAFYNAYIFRIKQIMEKEDDLNENRKNRFTFLIYPSISPTMSLEQISLENTLPCDRILTVKVGEKTLYDVEVVMYQMVHELAHYVGNELRCRDVRKRGIRHTLIKWIKERCEIQNIPYEFMEELLDRNASSEDDFMYLQDIHDRSKGMIRTLTDMEAYLEASKEFYYKQADDEDFYDAFLEERGIPRQYQRVYVKNYLDQYTETKFLYFRDCMKKMDTFKNAELYREYIDLIKAVYRECYADLQMILVLAMRAEDYLDTFLIGQGLSMQEIQKETEAVIRISTVLRVMINVGLWERPTESDNRSYRTAYDIFDRYNQQVAARTERDRLAQSQAKTKQVADIAKLYDFKDGIKLRKRLVKESDSEPDDLGVIVFPDLSADLYDYLLEVMEKSIQTYFDNEPHNKRNKILKVRKLVSTMLDSSDITEIFQCVERELRYCKRTGYRILNQLY